MSVRTESELWADERKRVARKQLSARSRAFAAWFGHVGPKPDHFVWRSVADLVPVELEP